MLGSFADVPKNVLGEIRELERLFTVDTEKLKEITNHFVDELTKGMSGFNLLLFDSIGVAYSIIRSNHERRKHCMSNILP